MIVGIGLLLWPRLYWLRFKHFFNSASMTHDIFLFGYFPLTGKTCNHVIVLDFRQTGHQLVNKIMTQYLEKNNVLMVQRYIKTIRESYRQLFLFMLIKQQCVYSLSCLSAYILRHRRQTESKAYHKNIYCRIIRVQLLIGKLERSCHLVSQFYEFHFLLELINYLSVKLVQTKNIRIHISVKLLSKRRIG